MGKLTGSGSGGSTTTESKPWAPAIPLLEKILGSAGDLFDSQGGINAEWIDKEVADLTPEMQQAVKDMLNSDQLKQTIGQINQAGQQGLSGIGQATGALGGLTQQGITGENINKLAEELYDTEMVKGQKESLGKDIEQGLNKRVQGINQQAAGTGNMGSSRAGVAEGVATGEAADAYATGASNIENAARTSAYGQALGTLQGNQSTALGAAGALGQLGLGSGGLMSGNLNAQNQILQNQLTGAGILQGHNQNVANNNWFNATGQQNMGWDMLGKLTGIAGGIGGMGGTSTSTQNQGSGNLFNSLLGAGATLGGAYLTGGASLASSDISMKKKIKKKKGKTEKGSDQYSWEWNKSAEKRDNKKGKSEGVLAQAVAKDKPEAVVNSEKTGRLMVDYDKV